MNMLAQTSHVFHSPSRAQGGFSLMEVLIAVLILAIGLLGLAGLQTFSLQSNVNAYQRSQATALSYEIIDAMRTNRDIARAGGYDLALGAAPAGGASVNAQDVFAWYQRVTNLLPAAQASIQPLGVNVYTVTLQWSDSKRAGAAAGDTQTFTVTTQL